MKKESPKHVSAKHQVDDVSFTTVLARIEQFLHNSGIGKGDRQSEVMRLVLCLVASQNSKYTPEEISRFGEKEIRDLLSKASANLPNVEVGSFKLNGEALKAAWAFFTGLDFSGHKDTWAQDLFMKFGPQFLRKDLDQYFTPSEIAVFMANVLEFKTSSSVIDPAGGSGDFLTTAAATTRIRSKARNTLRLAYLDKSEEAEEVAELNFWLNGVTAETYVVDSIGESTLLEDSFDFCITNPPFGTKTTWDESQPIELLRPYTLGHRWRDGSKTEELFRQQLGILFIERGLKLLKAGGILAIVLPSGYMSNPSESYLRRWLLTEHRVLAVVALPGGTFKKSGAGVTPCILFVQKGRSRDDYEILMASADSIGFDFKKQDTPKIFKRNPISGEFQLDSDGNQVPANDLLAIEDQFAKFASENRIMGLRKNAKTAASFVSVSRDDTLSTTDLVLSPKRYSAEYLQVIDKISSSGYKTLREMNAAVSNSNGFSAVPTMQYLYLDIGEIGTGNYRSENLLYGWELPGRAKQSVVKGDVLVARLAGSASKFCVVSGGHERQVASNGLFKISIPDERDRLLFLHFLYSRDYRIQFEALATGSIMEDVKLEDFIDQLLIPTNIPSELLAKTEKFLALQQEIMSS